MARRRPVGYLLMAVGLALISAVGLAQHSAAASTASTSSAVTVSRTVTRTFLENGVRKVQASNKVTLKVAQTQNLRSLQLVHVSWTGAKPTGGLVADHNSDVAQNQEYPFILLECRGTDTAAHPLTPNTCWTQYADERFDAGYDDPPYPAWRSDSAATAAQRAAIVDQPAGALPKACVSYTIGVTTQRWVPFIGAGGTTYAGGALGCAGQPAEAASQNLGSNLALPTNETFGVTDTHGAGSADFDIFTAEDHASLGCSQSVACTLVALPIEGLSCDPAGSLLPAADRPSPVDAAAAAQACESGPYFTPGEQLPSQSSGNPAVDGQLWWSPSNWANRISVPLSFALPDDACSLSSSGDPVDIYGSELMIQASTQWAPHFCLNKSLFDYTHVQTPEPLARSLLANGSIEAAYTSRPADSDTPYPYPTVNAPVAVTGWGIAYQFDDGDGTQVTTLRLDARLLAKLLTESYPAQQFIKTGDPGLQNNPLNITQDPEFQALNPGIPERLTEAAATLLALNTDSDVMYSLTSYINADPEARAWLNGAPDPWGMTVNPAYQSIKLPVDSWPLLDTYVPTDEYQPGRIDCLIGTSTPYLPLVAAPTARLANISQDMEFALAQTQTKCVLPAQLPGDLAGAKMVATGRQPAGEYAMLGIVSLGDAARDGLHLADLESYTDPYAPAKITTAATGRSFAAADDAGLKAAVAATTPDEKTGVWPIDDTVLRSSAHASAYPGTMIVYAAVPTSKLPKGDGARYATVLRYAAGDGQRPGSAIDQLPPGYLPMTAANGMGRLVAYTECAAKAVAAQRGVVPSLTGTCPSTSTKPSSSVTPTPSPSGSTTTTSTGGSTGGGTSGGGTTTGGSTTGGTTAPTQISTAPTPSPSASAGPSVSATPVLTSATTPAIGSGIGGWVLPVLLILGIASLLAGVIVRVGAR